MLRSYSSATRFSSNQRPLGQFVPVAIQDSAAGISLLHCRESDEAHNSGMWLRSDHGKFAEVLINRENDLSRVQRMREDSDITRIGRPINNTLDFVTSFSERRRYGPSQTRVDQNPHLPRLSIAGSTLSWLTRRFAYTRQA
jgi:hypothetical protein